MEDSADLNELLGWWSEYANDDGITPSDAIVKHQSERGGTLHPSFEPPPNPHGPKPIFRRLELCGGCFNKRYIDQDKIICDDCVAGNSTRETGQLLAVSNPRIAGQVWVAPLDTEPSKEVFLSGPRQLVSQEPGLTWMDEAKTWIQHNIDWNKLAEIAEKLNASIDNKKSGNSKELTHERRVQQERESWRKRKRKS